MSQASCYWTISQLTAAGQVKRVEIPAAHRFFHQHFPHLAESDEQVDGVIQTQLLALLRSSDPPNEAIATLCLRCFISHQIVQVCTSLHTQFGHYYGFTLADILPTVLNDDGKLPAHPHCLAQQILQKFQPESSNLATWTTRLVRQHHELNAVLVEHGLYLVSDWAILNDTKPEQLRRILAFYGLSAGEIDRACLLLESYRSVYLLDRLKQGRGKCADPTLEQLERIRQLVQAQTTSPIAAATLLAQLQSLAKRLRQYRIYKRGGPLPVGSIDTPAGKKDIEQVQTEVADAPEQVQQQVFLQNYRLAFLKTLDQALEQVIGDRQQAKPHQATQFAIALQLFYCQRLSMSAIAQQLGLPRQDSVTRLLKLKDFRADVRRHMLQYLKRDVLKQAAAYCDPDRLQQLDDQLEAALSEQIETLMQQDASRAQTPNHLMVDNVFTQKICQFLDRAVPQLPSQPGQNHE